MGDLKLAPVFEISGDAGPPEGMAADPTRVEAGDLGPGLAHAKDRGAAQRAPRERTSYERAEDFASEQSRSEAFHQTLRRPPPHRLIFQLAVSTWALR